MAQTSNPFEHHHHHHHDDPAGVEPRLDPAQESLADALRVTFFLLKTAMLVLVVVYLFSGLFTVKEQEAAVRLFFGRIVGEPGQQVITTGGPHLTFPYPIGEVKKVQTTVRQITLDQSFWFQLSPEDRARTASEIADTRTGPLNPERDSYLVTGDASIIHAQWTLSYRVSDPVLYLENVGGSAEEERLVGAAAEKGILAFAAEQTADQMTDGLSEAETSRLLRLIQAGLDGAQSGLTAISIAANAAVVPNPVRDAFQESNRADIERRRQIDVAQAAGTRILTGVAGDAHEELWRIIQAYDVAREAGDEAQVAEQDARLTQAFETLVLETPRGPLDIGGKAADLVLQAKAYRTQIVESVRSEAEQFQLLLGSYRQTPRIVRQRRWQEAVEQIFSGDNETFYVSGGQVYVELNSDPQIAHEREKKRLQEEESQPRFK